MTVDIGWAVPDVAGRVAQLLADAQIAEGVYHEDLGDGGRVLPAITYRNVGKRPQNTHSGPNGMARSRIQVDVWAREKNEVAALAASVVSTLVGQSGNGIRSITQLFERDLRDPDRPVRRRVIDFDVWHDDPIPAS